MGSKYFAYGGIIGACYDGYAYVYCWLFGVIVNGGAIFILSPILKSSFEFYYIFASLTP
jgi:hypothetical protein